MGEAGVGEWVEEHPHRGKWQQEDGGIGIGDLWKDNMEREYHLKCK